MCLSDFWNKNCFFSSINPTISKLWHAIILKSLSLFLLAVACDFKIRHCPIFKENLCWSLITQPLMRSFVVIKPYILVDILKSVIKFSFVCSKPSLNLPICLRMMCSRNNMLNSHLFKHFLKLAFPFLLFANFIGIKTIGFLGRDGGKLKDIVNLPIIVPGEESARIQEVHILIAHIICDLVEQELTN